MPGFGENNSTAVVDIFVRQIIHGNVAVGGSVGQLLKLPPLGEKVTGLSPCPGLFWVKFACSPYRHGFSSRKPVFSHGPKAFV